MREEARQRNPRRPSNKEIIKEQVKEQARQSQCAMKLREEAERCNKTGTEGRGENYGREEGMRRRGSTYICQRTKINKKHKNEAT
jgi:hypothetical protein